MRFLVRFCTAILSAYLFAILMPNPAFLFWRFSACYDSWDASCDGDYLWYEKLASLFKIIAGCLWMAAWLNLELLAHRRSERQRPKLLTHLRYGPLVILVFSFAFVLSFDMIMIQYSRWKIIRYIHSNAAPQERPSFDLHNNYRHWCGNGMAAQEYSLYGETPSSEFESADPLIRARALQASIYTYDWLNVPDDGPFFRILEKAKNDSDPLVREIAEECCAGLH